MTDPNPVNAFCDQAARPSEPETDRVWFERHPERVHRLRGLIPFESTVPLGLPPLGMTWRILVTQLGTCDRLRLPVSLPRDVSNEGADDQQLALIFDQIAPPDLRNVITMKKRLRTQPSPRTNHCAARRVLPFRRAGNDPNSKCS
jgi:hypothetical protein